MENDYLAMALRAAEFLENEATPENTVSWIYNNRELMSRNLRLCAQNNTMGEKAQRLVNTVYHFTPLHKELEQG